MVYSLWFMEDRCEIKGTTITKLRTAQLLYYSTILLKTDN